MDMKKETEDVLREIGASEEYAQSYENFMEEIDRYVIDKAVITLTPGKKWNITRDRKGELHFRAERPYDGSFPRFFLASLKAEKAIGIVLRSFTRAIDIGSGLPIVELRSYLVYEEDGSVKYEQSSARQMADAYNTNSMTGERLPLEPAIIYCGPKGDYLGPDLNPILYR
ncbi:MAG: hypothetical protein OH316_02110 [Candidatus Parvarchaeota archaeon]|nr:hypothetical protein [Candidatus Parvarchaeota archaeon]